MNKTLYLNTGIASIIAFILLVVMHFTWPLTEISLHDFISGNMDLSQMEKEEIIESIKLSYALDTVFIFCWVLSWCGVFLYFRSNGINLVRVCFALSLLGAAFDLTENAISYSLLIGNNNNTLDFLSVHSVFSDISYYLPMLASFILVMMTPKPVGLPNILVKFTGTVGVLFAVLGMYLQIFSPIPDLWFGLWFLSVSLLLFEAYKK